MALYNEILVGRYNRFLQKFLSMKGNPPAPQLASEMAATWSLFHGAENRYLEGWDRFGAYTAQALLAAANAGVRFRNPTGSGVVIVFERILISNQEGAASAYQMGFGAQAADLATIQATTGLRWDPRGKPTPSVIISKANTVAQTGALKFNATIPNNTTIEVIPNDISEIPLLPGDALDIYQQTNAQGLNVTHWWRERILEDSEKA